MSVDIAAHWFWAQIIAATLACMAGRAIGRRSSSWGEIILVTTTLIAMVWSARRLFEDALVLLVPLDVLIYGEDTLIAPLFIMMAGAISVRAGHKRTRSLGVFMAVFGFVYLAFNGVWMISPRVQLSPHVAPVAASSVVAQSRPDTCVAAALASALRAPSLNVLTSEAEMARLADVRVGRGSTLLRALRAARVRLTGSSTTASLIRCTPDQVVALASRSRPALVELRSTLRTTHMVAVLGRLKGGGVLLADPASPANLSWRLPGAPCGSHMDASEFSRRFMGSAIVFVDTAAPALRAGWSL